MSLRIINCEQDGWILEGGVLSLALSLSEGCTVGDVSRTKELCDRGQSRSRGETGTFVGSDGRWGKLSREDNLLYVTGY